MERAPLENVDDPRDGAPGWAEVEQHEALPELGIPAVPVHVDGPVTTHELPPRTSVMRTVSIGTTPVELLPGDKRRKRAVILSSTAIVYALTSSAARTPAGSVSDGAEWPANVQLTLFGSSQVFAATATGTARVTVISESWAD